MKYAVLTVVTVAVACPVCHEAIPEPNSGSLMWDVDELLAMKEKKATCPNCDQEVKISEHMIKPL